MDPSIQIVVTSAVGKDQANTSKLTDLLFLLYAHLQYGVDYESIIETILARFMEIKQTLSLQYDIASEINELRKELNKAISKDYLVSRGEYYPIISGLYLSIVLILYVCIMMALLIMKLPR